MSISVEELRTLIEEYLKTRNDNEGSETETFLTPHDHSVDEMDDFLYWFEHRDK